eukprot:COSAG04_NODE_14671_length_559_cov_2.553191_1_plen_127_part_10
MAEGGRREGARTGPPRPIVQLAQLGVLQLGVRLRQRLELLLITPLVRVGLDRLPAEGLRDLLGGGGALNADDLVQALAMARHARLARVEDAAPAGLEAPEPAELEPKVGGWVRATGAGVWALVGADE